MKAPARTYQIFLFSLCAALFLVAMQAQATNCRPTEDSCQFYLCKEEENPCGTHGYWLGYGYRYCERFLEKKEQFSEATQQWFKSVRYCLQDEARLFNNHESCQDSYREAMNSHVDCYTEAGFCALSFRERAKVIWTLKSALLLPITYVEGLELQLQCLSEHHGSSAEL